MAAGGRLARTDVSVTDVRSTPINVAGIQAYHDAVAAEGPRVVDEARAALSMLATIETGVLRGIPDDEIVREARDWDADLVVLGARGLGAMEAFLLGSVSVAVARHAHCAVLVVKGRGHLLERVVVGIDGSDESLNAVRFLAALPLDSRHSVQLVGVVEPVHLPATAPSAIRQQIQAVVDDIKEGRRSALTKAMDQAAPFLEAQGICVSRVMSEGHPAERLTAAEPEPDLIVVGARGIGGVARLLLGSVSENVLRSARCPVLIVKRA